MAIAEKLKHHSRHILGVFSILAVVYLNFGDKLKLPPIFFRQPQMSFITTNSYRFVDESDGQFFFINGWNSYWLMEESVWASTRPRVSKMLRKGSDMGMTVCRTWAFSDGGENGSHALQIAPGVFDERVFQALDFVIVEARRHRIRLILSLVNNLNAFGGKAQYVKWAQASGVNVTSPDPFFTHPIIKEYYKGYIKSILTRKNSFSGVRYSEEPAIFAWELMNEPRCVSSSSAPALQTWIGEMAEFIKSLDQKHLVTVGLEGFYGTKRTARTEVNPGEWAGLLGSDFIQNSATEHIDFASVHAYPDSWIPSASPDDKAKYLANWVDSHVSDGEFELKKPVLFTEVGSTSRRKEQGLHNRDLFLKTIYDKIYESAKKRQAGAGALIWQLLVEGMEEYGDDFSLVAWAHASTYKLIVEQSCRLKHLLGKGEVGVKIGDMGLCAGVIY